MSSDGIRYQHDHENRAHGFPDCAGDRQGVQRDVFLKPRIPVWRNRQRNATVDPPG
jgi:hypothetical protein